MLEERSHLPDVNRLSILIATVLLAYAVTPFIQIPERELHTQLPGIFLTFTLSFATITSVLAAALAGVGADWLMRGHPQYGVQPGDTRHWLMPALTAWVIGEPLNRLEVGLQWWGVFAFGLLLLALVNVAEYVALDPGDSRYGLAAVTLNALAFALFLILCIALRASGPRLYVILPALVVAVFLTTMRTLYLRLGSRWIWKWPIAIAVVIGQLVVALHYWPLAPLQFGLVLLGAAYALTSTAVGLEEGRAGRALLLEPAILLLASWLMAALVQV